MLFWLSVFFLSDLSGWSKVLNMPISVLRRSMLIICPEWWWMSNAVSTSSLGGQQTSNKTANNRCSSFGYYHIHNLAGKRFLQNVCGWTCFFKRSVITLPWGDRSCAGFVFASMCLFSVLMGHTSPRGHLSPRSISIYLGWLRSICTLKSIFKIVCYQFLRTESVNWGSLAPSHLVFGISRIRTNIWHLSKHFDK